jgi:LL-diaminopimelate aminotransferase
MIKVNDNFLKLRSSYLFSEIAGRVEAFQKEHPDTAIIKLGIGDVTEPLPEPVVRAFESAVKEMGHHEGFRGYGPEQGYPFLREAIAANDYGSRNTSIDANEIFVSDGSKCDVGNFQELFAVGNRVAIPDPVYPVYIDTNVMAGRTGEPLEVGYEGVTYLPCREDNGYVPGPPAEEVDLIYLCFPNNPTGAVATHAQLAEWVDYAREHRALILFDAAYYAYIQDDSVPRSIYEVEGAREVAVEFRSFSKTAGFTGTRCAFTVVPEECRVYQEDGTPVPLRPLWNRRHSTKFNGVAYPVQRAAEAIYTPEGQEAVSTLVQRYMANAKAITETFEELGFATAGGKNAPYVWIHGKGESSWELFDRVLSHAGVVVTPGVGFGKEGEGYIRISAFNSPENVSEALGRIKKVFV